MLAAVTGHRIEFARSGDRSIAYTTVGTGPVDLVWLPAMASNLDVLLEEPCRSFVDALADFSRVLMFDRRGVGLSDEPQPTESPSSLSEWVDDFVAVTEAAGVAPTSLVCFDNGGLMGLLVSATRPDLVDHLVLVNGFPRLSNTDGYHAGYPPELGEAIAAMIERRWGHGAIPALQRSAMSDDPRWAEWWGRLERGSSGRSLAAAAWRDYWDLDVRSILSNVEAPVLLAARAGFSGTDYLERHLPNAERLTFAATDPYGYFDEPDFSILMSRMAEFVTGRPAPARSDRVLATVLFTRVSRSAASHRRAGDAAWHRLLDEHDRVARTEVTRRRGTLVRTTGDGIVAMFDTPGAALESAAALHSELGRDGTEMRAGIHAGEVELRDADIAGPAVRVAARILDLAGPGEVLVTATVKDLLGRGRATFVDRGSHLLEGLGERWQLYSAVTTAQRATGSRGRAYFGWESLTPTELEVVHEVAEGRTNPQVGTALSMSRDTVKTHLSHIFSKLGVTSRTQLAVLAARRVDEGQR